MANMTANQRLAGHIKACEQQMSCVYARTAAEAKQIERRVAAGSLEAVMPGLYARPEYWSELKFRQRYLHRVRALAQKHPDWTFCSYTAAVIYGLSVSHANLTHHISPWHRHNQRRRALRSFAIVMFVKHGPPRWTLP